MSPPISEAEDFFTGIPGFLHGLFDPNEGSFIAHHGTLESGAFAFGIGENYLEFFDDEGLSVDFFGHAALIGHPAPIPAPASVLLLGSGLAGMARLRRKLFKR